MKYTKVILHNYKRFSLNPFKTVEIDFTSDVSVVLGTNGCGKSSLLKELLTLPADKASYNPEGYKVSHISHGGKDYVLKSEFLSSVHHSFTVDGVCLYEGHNSEMMRSLVNEHFGLNKKTIKMILGLVKLTDLSSAQRGELFIELCESDYTYAVEVYNRLKVQHRDRLGAIKMLSTKLVELGKDQLAQSEEDSLVEHAKLLHSTLNTLMQHRVPVESTEFELSEKGQELLSVVQTLTKACDDSLSTLGMPQNDETLNEALQTISAQLSREQGALNHLAEQVSEKQKQLNKAYGLSEGVQLDIKRELGELNLKLSDLQCLELSIQDATQALSQLNEVRPSFTELCSSVCVNDGKYGSAVIKELLDKQLALKNKAHIAQSMVSGLAAKTAHMSEHRYSKGVQCPKCKHGFNAHYNEADYEKLCTDLDLRKKELAALNTSLDKIKEQIDENYKWRDDYYMFIACMQKAPYLKPYFDHFDFISVFRLNPKLIVSRLSEIASDLSAQFKKDLMLKRKQNLLDRISSDTLVSDQLLAQQQEHIQSLQEQVNKITSKAYALEKLRLLVQQECAKRVRLKNLTQQLQAALQSNENHYHHYKEQARRNTYNAIVSFIQSELAQKETALRKSQNTALLINQTQAQIDEYKEQAADIKILIDELSPTDGLIAHGLFGFMSRFIAQMNSLIESIWNYSLVVKAPSVQEGDKLELDYKFPMIQQGEPIQDVSLGSTGMMDMVNLAFRITALNYYKQLSFFVLDEPFVTLDKEHRQNALQAVKAIVQDKVFEQVFMVSHYADMHENFKNADFIALNKMNITVPSNCNESVTFD